MRVRAILSASLAALASALVPSVGAAAWPEKPIRMIIGFPAGGPLDAHARILVDSLTRSLGQPVVIDYKPGAGGTIGADLVVKAPPDGYTLLMANTGTMMINPFIYRNGYDTLRDFTPIARTAQQPLAIVVHPSVPAKTLAEFIDLAKKQPGKLNYGSAGTGGISHLVPEMLQSATGIQIVHVPYKGSAPAFTDLLAGQVQLIAESIPQVAQYVKIGKVRALAMTGSERSPAIPDVPTMREAGVKDFEVVGFYGVLAPAKLPADVTAALGDAFRKALAAEEVRSRMVQQGADPAFLDPAAFAAYLKASLPRWGAAVKKADVKLD